MAMETGEIVKFKFAPINSVDVDWLFSIYKNILLERRKSFKLPIKYQKIIAIHLQCNLDNTKPT